MPAVPATPRVKLRATSRRVPRVRSAASGSEPDHDSEPNMRLSRAIVVMLLLHVVAVGGILAFSLIKERNADRRALEAGRDPASAVEAEYSLVPTTKPAVRSESSAASVKPSTHLVQPGETLVQIANDNGVTVESLIAANGAQTAMSSLKPGQELKLPDKSPDPKGLPAEHSLPTAKRSDGGAMATGTATGKAGRLPPDSGKTYTVGKGESPYVIARKLKVSYESLLRLNGIADPKKLKPGQKLRVPVQSAAQ